MVWRWRWPSVCVVAIRNPGDDGGGCFALWFRVWFWVFFGLGLAHLVGLWLLCFIVISWLCRLSSIFFIVLSRLSGPWVFRALPFGCSNLWLDLFLSLDVTFVELI